MSSYIQLLGSDTPESCGGCCYYGKFNTTTFHNSVCRKEPNHSSAIAKNQNFTLDKDKPSQMACRGVEEEDGYLFFNCPEGTQRFSSEGKIKLTKIKCFLFTRWGAFHNVKQLEEELKMESQTQPRKDIYEHIWYNNKERNNETHIKLYEARQSRGSECTHSCLDICHEVKCSNEDKLECCARDSSSVLTMEQNNLSASNELDAKTTMQQFETPLRKRKEKYQQEQEHEELEEWEEEEEEEEYKQSSTVNESAASAVMGLPGLLFTINDAGVKETTLFGPSTVFNVYELFKATCERYETRSGLQCKTTVPEEESSKETISDNYIVKEIIAKPKIRELSGVERFIYVMKKHFFTYRTMKFKQLMPLYYIKNNVDNNNTNVSSSYHYHGCCCRENFIDACNQTKVTSYKTTNTLNRSNLLPESLLPSASLTAWTDKKAERIAHPEVKHEELFNRRKAAMCCNNVSEILPLWEAITSSNCELTAKQSKTNENVKADYVTHTQEKAPIHRQLASELKLFLEKCHEESLKKEKIRTLSQRIWKPCIIASLLLDDQTLLIAFRVSGKASMEPAFPICEHRREQHQENSLWEHESALCDASKCTGNNTYCKVCTDSIATTYAADTSDLIISYAIMTAPRRKFDPNKARKLGVCYGPDFGNLKRGKCVRNAEGNEIQPDQVTVTTIGSLHLFITLILDGLHPSQVRRAVEQLLGNNVSCVEENDERSNEEGELRRYLREKYPGFILYNNNVVNEEDSKVNNHTMVECAECNKEKGGEKQEMEVPHANTDSVESISLISEKGLKRNVELHHDENLEISNRSNKMRESSVTRERNVIGSAETHLAERNLIIVMSVVHLQPHSYFTNLFTKYSTNNVVVNEGSLYEKYTEYIFHRVSKRVLRSTEVMLNFSKENFEESTVSNEQDCNSCAKCHTSNFDGCTKTGDMETNKKNNNSHSNIELWSKDNSMHAVTITESKHSRSDMNVNHEWSKQRQNMQFNKENKIKCTRVSSHLFTSFLYVHYTAFPTALTHRYHLHFIAPSLFPLIDGKYILQNINGTKKTSTSSDQSTEKHEEEKSYEYNVDKVKDSMANVQFWPYGCRWHTLPVWVNRELIANKDNLLAHTTEGKSTILLSSSSSSSSSSSALELFNSSKELMLVDKLAALIKYPTAESANKLLSQSFVESIIKKLTNTTISNKSKTLVNRSDNICNNYEDESMHRNTTRNDSNSIRGSYFLQQQEQNVCINDNDNGGALVFLGTGSAIPGKYRNVSSAYLELHIPSQCLPGLDECLTNKTLEKDCFVKCVQDTGNNLRRAIVLLDFGEGSMGQLCNMLKEDNSSTHEEEILNTTNTCLHRSTQSNLIHSQHSKHILWESREQREQMYGFVRDILFVFISHSHADHHLGLLSLLELRHQALQEVQSHACSHQREGHSNIGVNEESNVTEPRKMPLTNKLLVVCPVEVESFIIDMWGTTKPYSDWIQSECIFDTFTVQPPTEIVEEQLQERLEEENREHYTQQTVNEQKQEEYEEYEEEEVGELRKFKLDDNKLQTGECMKCEKENNSTNCCCKAMTNLYSKCNCHNDDDDENNLVKKENKNATLPHLSALCKVLNDRLRQIYMNEWELDKHINNATLWAVEVCPVDHPANAHALLFRFPRFHFTSTEMKGKVERSSDSNVINNINYYNNNSGSTTTESESKCNCETAGGHSYCRESIGNYTPEHVSSTDCETSDKCLTKNKQCCTLHSRTFLFSGDTRPSAYLINQCRRFCRHENLSICLHEATFGPGYENEAKDKRHSTLTEALAVASSMNAETIVLNHFSQRYPKLPASVKEQIEGNEHKNNSQSTQVTTWNNECYSNNADKYDSNGDDGDNTMKLASQLSNNNITYTTDVETNNMQTQCPKKLANICFAFDMMRISFADMESRVAHTLTPLFIELSEEYESWGVGTTKRLRERYETQQLENSLL